MSLAILLTPGSGGGANAAQVTQGAAVLALLETNSTEAIVDRIDFPPNTILANGQNLEFTSGLASGGSAVAQVVYAYP